MELIKLHQFRPFWGLPNASPFCMKAETYLRYAGINYKTVASDPGKSPSKQIPYVTTKTETIADSQRIIEHFEMALGNELDAGLSEQDQALAWFIRTRIEEELYWQITYMRWGDPQGWKVFLPDLKKYMPGWKKYLLPWVIRKMLLKKMGRRGMSAQNATASYAPGITLLEALSDYLGNKPFFLGDQIRSLDMSLYAFLANIIYQPYPNILQDHARELTNLVACCDRIKEMVWNDWQPDPV